MSKRNALERARQGAVSAGEPLTPAELKQVLAAAPTLLLVALVEAAPEDRRLGLLAFLPEAASDRVLDALVIAESRRLAA